MTSHTPPTVELGNGQRVELSPRDVDDIARASAHGDLIRQFVNAWLTPNPREASDRMNDAMDRAAELGYHPETPQ